MDSSGATERGSSTNGSRQDVDLIDVKVGDTLADRFLLREVLGHGATGTVFSALDRSVGQKVAIKLLHPDLHDERTRERLRREVRASRESHPNLVAVYDLHEIDNHVFLSMELVEGQSLKERLWEHQRLCPADVISIGQNIAAALSHLHQNGIIHRDIKPGNILLAPDGTAKLCDMGLARPLEEGMTVTETEMVVGTPAYMAPEQGLGDDLTAASDVYGLGLTLYQCLTGSVPLTSETAVATLTRRQRERPPAVRKHSTECPRWLSRLLRRMLEPSPKERPPASKVCQALHSEKIWPRPRRRTTIVIAGCALAVVFAAIIGPQFFILPTVRTDYDDQSVFGLDENGKQTWSYALPDPPLGAQRYDLNADGRKEIILSGRPSTGQETRHPDAVRSYVVALSEEGDLVTHLVPEDLIGNWKYPFRLDIFPIVSLHDLDGDGWREIVVNCRHNGFYPAVLLAYWPRWDAWDSLLHHPGSVIAIDDAHESNRPGLRFVAYNNLLGMTKVYGEIDVIPPANRAIQYGRSTVLLSPPGPMPPNATIGSWRTYVPFAQGRAVPFRDDAISVEWVPEKVISLQDRGPTFDEFFNPIDGPNAGLDLRGRRLGFAESLYDLQDGKNAITSDGVRRTINRIRSNAGPLMDEPQYDLILSVLGARALAGVNELEAAIALLETTRARRYDDELLHCLAHLYALNGDAENARSTLLYAIDNGSTTRSKFDVPLLLLQLAISRRDSEDVATAIEFLTVRGRPPDLIGPTSELQTRFGNSLAARARVWWDVSTPMDGQIRIVNLDADGDAVACLARWRQGGMAADEAEKMRLSINLNPDSFNLGTVALSAALMSNGRLEEALSEIDRVISALTHSARWNFIDAEILDLAKAVKTVVLEAAGDRNAALTSARELESELDPNLLPGILIREVSDRMED